MVQLQLVILFLWLYSLNCNPNSTLKKDGIKLQGIKAKKESKLISAAECFCVTLAAQKRQGAGGKRMATLHHCLYCNTDATLTSTLLLLLSAAIL